MSGIKENEINNVFWHQSNWVAFALKFPYACALEIITKKTGAFMIIQLEREACFAKHWHREVNMCNLGHKDL